MKSNIYDVIIIGGGPAGLSAALILGRSRRKVILFDSRKYRNQYAQRINGYLTRDGIHPKDFITLGRQELLKYEIEIKEEEIENGFFKNEYFEVIGRDNNTYRSKKLLLATGLRDIIPKIKGFDDCYGISIFHCPYCDGWEIKDKEVGIYSRSKAGYELALSLYNWSKDIVLFTDGEHYLTEKKIKILKKHSIKVYTEKIDHIVHEKGFLKYLKLEDGKKIKRDTLFFNNGYTQQSVLGKKLGCNYSKKGVIINDKLQHTNIPGLFVAGDAAQDMKLVVVAAAEGAKAAIVINTELKKERVKRLTKDL